MKDDLAKPKYPSMNFRLPQGLSDIGDDEVNDIPCDNMGGQELSYADFPKGFSDDDGRSETLDRTFPGPKTQKTPLKGKKSPRRSDESESLRTKKSHKPLFGGDMGENEDSEEPKALGHKIGQRLSSLTLDNEHHEMRFGGNMAGNEADVSDPESSPRHSPAPSNHPVIIPPEEIYELRKGIDRQPGYTWVDADQSGNYDPQEESRQRMAKLNKAKAKKRGKSKQKAEPKESTMKCIVRLHFGSAMGTVRNITSEEDNWPDDWSVLGSDCEREIRESRAFYRQKTPGVKPQEPIRDPRGEFADLTGMPIARGCQECRKCNQACSMVENGKWPCEQCSEDNVECHPVIPHNSKGRCKRCDEFQEECCSFEIGGNAALQPICEQCLMDDHMDCEASPPRDYKAKRIDLDQIMYSPDRPFTTCTNCREHGRRCSLKKKEDKPPCKYCKRHGIACTFYGLPPKVNMSKNVRKQKAGAQQEEGESSRSKIASEVFQPNSEFFSPEDLEDMEVEDEVEEVVRQPTPEIEMEDSQGRKGMLTKIKTSFAHPIQFSAMKQDALDCNFCEMPMFGLVGHFEREVHVIRWHNGLGYTELGGGWCEERYPTTMCQECTLHRVLIISCEEHNIQPIESNGEALSVDEVIESTLIAEPGSDEMRRELLCWCSMCFAIATSKCTTPCQPLLGEDNDTVLDGCGLRLCADCEKRLRGEFGGDCSAMACALDREPKAQEGDEGLNGFTARADVGLLNEHGLLLLNVASEAQREQMME